MTGPRIVVDGNEAVARVAHSLSEVVAIYPITPASPMGEAIDAWAHAGRPNLWGSVPTVVEMQSEAGAAGAVHGAVQGGALTTTFTASQGLLLMIPDLYKIAGELTPCVIHVAARSLATHALSIFGDHSDVMAVRQTGAALLASGSVQEAQDLAVVAHAATLASRVPFVHFFDGFRTSHEMATIEPLCEDDLRALIDDELVDEHRRRRLDPDRPDIRGTAQNPDVFFQAREASNPYHDAVGGHVAAAMDALAARTGRTYGLFDYTGAPDAERVVVVMGSAAGTVAGVVEDLAAAGEKVGLVTVRLYRPFDVGAFDAALPRTTRRVAVLDRTKEPGSVGEPLHVDVVAALAQARPTAMPDVVGGRYGLSSKEFTPAMAAAVFDALGAEHPPRRFTVGITDDVTHLSLPVDDGWTEPDDVFRAVFHGLGSDGTVGANKNSVKIVGEHTDLHAQGYFVYDSRKAGAQTVSHLRFGPRPIRAAHLVADAHFVACHDFGFLERRDVLARARPGATFLLNSPWPASEVWDQLPVEVQRRIVDLDLDVWVVDADTVAREAGLGGRVNTVLQTCFFALTDLLATDEAVAAIKDAVRSTYGRRGQVVVARNELAVDAALDALERVDVPPSVTSSISVRPVVPDVAPDFVRRVTAAMLADRGDLLPVSALPVDGRFPPATARWEKRGLADEIPIWDPELCIDCGRCALVCPHAAIRMTTTPPDRLAGAPATFASKPLARSDDGTRLIVQVAPDDCTGCGVCVSICPARSKEVARHKAIDMEPRDAHLVRERANFAFFETLPPPPRTDLALDTVKGSQLAAPLFEFSGACAGCGETPYLKLLSQLFGDRIVVANATGCSSIYGANLPTTPWSTDGEGRGPAWANSLFEDNAEFGLGIRLARDHLRAEARSLVESLRDELGPLADELLAADDHDDEAGLAAQRFRIADLRERLARSDRPEARRLGVICHHLARSSVWIVGGDGWAYDIGFGGLDHVLASGRDVNVLVLDTEVYSNTGGQTSKATPRAAIAKFSAGGKSTGKKDLGMIAMAHPGVYVAQVAMGANMTQVVKAFVEADAHRGPSLVIAYSPCIAHGIDMGQMMHHQKLAAETGYWPLYRYDPDRERRGEHALHLDSRAPTRPFSELAEREGRFAMLSRAAPERAAELLARAQADIDDRWHLYEQMVEVEHTATYGIVDDDPHDDGHDEGEP